MFSVQKDRYDDSREVMEKTFKIEEGDKVIARRERSLEVSNGQGVKWARRELIEDFFTR